MNAAALIFYPLGDLDAAKAVHAALLGTEAHTDQAFDVGLEVGGVEMGRDWS
jgi:hypothetical protein